MFELLEKVDLLIAEQSKSTQAILDAIAKIQDYQEQVKLTKVKLTKVKELIKKLIDTLETIDGEQVRELEAVKEAE